MLALFEDLRNSLASLFVPGPKDPLAEDQAPGRIVNEGMYRLSRRTRIAVSETLMTNREASGSPLLSPGHTYAGWCNSAVVVTVLLSQWFSVFPEAFSALFMIYTIWSGDIFLNFKDPPCKDACKAPKVEPKDPIFDKITVASMNPMSKTAACVSLALYTTLVLMGIGQYFAPFKFWKMEPITREFQQNIAPAILALNQAGIHCSAVLQLSTAFNILPSGSAIAIVCAAITCVVVLAHIILVITFTMIFILHAGSKPHFRGPEGIKGRAKCFGFVAMLIHVITLANIGLWVGLCADEEFLRSHSSVSIAPGVLTLLSFVFGQGNMVSYGYLAQRNWYHLEMPH